MKRSGLARVSSEEALLIDQFKAELEYQSAVKDALILSTAQETEGWELGKAASGLAADGIVVNGLSNVTAINAIRLADVGRLMTNVSIAA